jgi:rubrerythrin
MKENEEGVMSFEQTRDVLNVARQFHVELADLYQRILNRAANEEARQLIGTLIEHEQQLEQRLGEYQQGGAAHILDTFFKYRIDEFSQCFKAYVPPVSIAAKEIIEVTRHFDQQLGDFYKEMAQKALSEQVREVLLNLMQMELQEQMSLSRRTLELSLSE